MWHWLWDREYCLGLLLPSCQNTFCSFLLCFTHTPIGIFQFLSTILSLRPDSLSQPSSDMTEVSGRQTVVFLCCVWVGAERLADISGNPSEGAGSVSLLPELFRQGICRISSEKPKNREGPLDSKYSSRDVCHDHRLFILSNWAIGLSITKPLRPQGSILKTVNHRSQVVALKIEVQTHTKEENDSNREIKKEAFENHKLE